jgi:Tol biopolymer transport system component
MPRARAVLLPAVLLAAGCAKDAGNPFEQFSSSQPPSADAVLLFVSGSWAEEPGQPRELFAINADGSQTERLTTCTQATPPCDLLRVAPSASRSRVATVRTTPDAEPGTAGLYFMDLERSVETTIVTRRRVSALDWSTSDTFILYSAADETGNEDLYTVAPNGAQDAPLTSTLDVHERNPRLHPQGISALYEAFDATHLGAVAIVLSDGSTGLITRGGVPGAEALAGTPYVVGSDADPVFSPDGQTILFRRLSATGNGGLGVWDLYALSSTDSEPHVLVGGGSLCRGAPDWGPNGIVFVETDAAASESRLVVVQPDGSGRTVLRVENPGYEMASPRWLR